MEKKIRWFWVAPTGERFEELPGKWHNITPFTAEQATAHNWVRRWEKVVSPARTTCTKYELVQCLSEHFPELLSQLRTAYGASADLQFYWNTVVQLDRNNADFQSAVQALGITDAQLDAIFSLIEEV